LHDRESPDIERFSNRHARTIFGVSFSACEADGSGLRMRRIDETMSHKITAMNHGQGFTANLTTAILVRVR